FARRTPKMSQPLSQRRRKHFQPLVEQLEDRRLLAALVGFVDDRTGLAGDATYITAAGQIPMQLTDADMVPATLDTLDVLVLGLANGTRNAGLMANINNIFNWVNAGGNLIIHDSNPGANATQLVAPGLGGSTFVGLLTSANMDVLDATSPIINGPFGVIDNNSLDGGTSSTHGYVIASTLPAGVDQVM